MLVPLYTQNVRNTALLWHWCMSLSEIGKTNLYAYPTVIQYTPHQKQSFATTANTITSFGYITHLARLSVSFGMRRN